MLRALVLAAALPLISGCREDCPVIEPPEPPCSEVNAICPDLLEGTWILTKVGRDRPEVIISMEFEEDGDFTFCYFEDCYDGEWEWNTDMDQLSIEYEEDGDTYELEIEVELLSEVHLDGVLEENGEEYDVEFARD